MGNDKLSFGELPGAHKGERSESPDKPSEQKETQDWTKRFSTYTVKEGETLTSIAKANHIQHVESLYGFNQHWLDPQVSRKGNKIVTHTPTLRAGHEIRIPDDDNAAYHGAKSYLSWRDQVLKKQDKEAKDHPTQTIEGSRDQKTATADTTKQAAAKPEAAVSDSHVLAAKHAADQWHREHTMDKGKYQIQRYSAGLVENAMNDLTNWADKSGLTIEKSGSDKMDDDYKAEKVGVDALLKAADALGKHRTQQSADHFAKLFEMVTHTKYNPDDFVSTETKPHGPGNIVSNYAKPHHLEFPQLAKGYETAQQQRVTVAELTAAGALASTAFIPGVGEVTGPLALRIAGKYVAAETIAAATPYIVVGTLGGLGSGAAHYANKASIKDILPSVADGVVVGTSIPIAASIAIGTEALTTAALARTAASQLAKRVVGNEMRATLTNLLGKENIAAAGKILSGGAAGTAAGSFAGGYSAGGLTAISDAKEGKFDPSHIANKIGEGAQSGAEIGGPIGMLAPMAAPLLKRFVPAKGMQPEGVPPTEAEVTTTVTGKLETSKTAPPTDVSKTTPPADVSKTTPPTDVSKTTPPADVSKTTPPTDAPKTTPPADVSKTTPPADAPKTTPPADVSKTTPPADVSKTTPPADISKTTPPTDISKTTPPTDISKTAPPTDVSKTARPANASKTASPADISKLAKGDQSFTVKPADPSDFKSWWNKKVQDLLKSPDVKEGSLKDLPSEDGWEGVSYQKKATGKEIKEWYNPANRVTKRQEEFLDGRGISQRETTERYLNGEEVTTRSQEIINEKGEAEWRVTKDSELDNVEVCPSNKSKVEQWLNNKVDALNREPGIVEGSAKRLPSENGWEGVEYTRKMGGSAGEGQAFKVSYKGGFRKIEVEYTDGFGKLQKTTTYSPPPDLENGISPGPGEEGWWQQRLNALENSDKVVSIRQPIQADADGFEGVEYETGGGKPSPGNPFTSKVIHREFYRSSDGATRYEREFTDNSLSRRKEVISTYHPESEIPEPPFNTPQAERNIFNLSQGASRKVPFQTRANLTQETNLTGKLVTNSRGEPVWEWKNGDLFELGDRSGWLKQE